MVVAEPSEVKNEDVQRWFNDMERVVSDVTDASATSMEETTSLLSSSPLAFTPTRSKDDYLSDIALCHSHIRNGESYELCLTNSFSTHTTKNKLISPLNLYKTLRHKNPAPFSTYLTFNSHPSNVTICCSSPERFLSLSPNKNNDDNERVVISQPIKGTLPRLPLKKDDANQSHVLSTCPKNHAENLMIVDLL